MNKSLSLNSSDEIKQNIPYSAVAPDPNSTNGFGTNVVGQDY